VAAERRTWGPRGRRRLGFRRGQCEKATRGGRTNCDGFRLGGERSGSEADGRPSSSIAGQLLRLGAITENKSYNPNLISCLIKRSKGARSDGRGWVAGVRSRGRFVRLGPSNRSGRGRVGSVWLGRDSTPGWHASTWNQLRGLIIFSP
jgi:hypothetical protein